MMEHVLVWLEDRLLSVLENYLSRGHRDSESTTRKFNESQSKIETNCYYCIEGLISLHFCRGPPFVGVKLRFQAIFRGNSIYHRS